MNDFLWLVRREFWENKAIWVMPACIGALMVVAALFGKVEIAMLHASDQQSELAGVFFLVAIGGRVLGGDEHLLRLVSARLPVRRSQGPQRAVLQVDADH